MVTIKELLNKVYTVPNVYDTYLRKGIATPIFGDVFRVIGYQPFVGVIFELKTVGSGSLRINGKDFVPSSILKVGKNEVPIKISPTNLVHMFEYLTPLTIHFEKFDTSQVTDMTQMFYHCSSITSITGMENWNTSKVSDMTHLFNGCSSLTSLDLSSWSHYNVRYMSGMFNECSSLTHIKCTKAFRDWCWENANTMYLPTQLREGGTGTWEII